MIKIKFLDFVKDFLNPKTQIGGNNVVEDIDLSNIKAQIYFKEVALYTAISYIANAISKCEIKTFVKGKEVKEEEYFILNYSANINENSSLFWHKVIEKIFYSTKGEALVIVGRDKKLYCADDYTVNEFPMLGNRYENIRVGTLSLNRSYTIDEVFLFKLENTQVNRIIDGLNENYSELLTYAIKNYRKSNSSKYKLKLEEIEAGDEEFNETFEKIIKKQLKNFIESENAVYPEYKGQVLDDVTPKNIMKDSADILSIKKDIFETTAQAIKIPQSLMTGNITNVKEVMNTFITNAIDPYAKMIERELTRKEGYKKWKEGNYAKVDTSKINHIDILDVAEKLDKLISSGTACVDETRALIDMEPLNTDFSKTHFITKNYDTIENRLKGGDNNE